MKFHINCIKDYENSYGSVTIETAIIMPFFLIVLLFFVSFLQIVAAENILNKAALNVADKMCKWAPVYKNLLMDDLKDITFSKISESLGDEFGEYFNGALDDYILEILQLEKIGEYSYDYIYGYVSQKMCESYIEDNVLIKKNIVKVDKLNLYKSDFFHKGSNFIQLKAELAIDTYLPFDYLIKTNIDCAAWGSGVVPHVSVDSSKESNNSGIWKEDNFTRGKVIRQMYGGNLPDTFPVISKFENGMATMIKSLNHTSATYQDSSVFERTITGMINSMYYFNGGSSGGITIKNNDIYCKTIILVLPENDLTVTQQKALESVMRYATSKMIVIDLQRYQRV